jgi:hypothetical protein
MAVVGVLGVGLCVGGVRPGFLSLLSLPMAAGALAVAIFHVYLVYNGTLECPPGLFGLSLAPVQSLVILLLLVVLLLADTLRSSTAGGFSWPAASAPVVLGVLLGFAAIKSSPPPPAIPPGGWSKSIEEQGCRPVFRQPSRGQ